MDLQRGLILTAGPSITSDEIESVMEAVSLGWNSRHSEFIKKFQDEFAAYIGVKHAMATSSCTGALHLSMAALELKPGDEVIVPEMTWVASGAAPTYVQASPVFADVEEDTWCVSPESILRKITPKTKAIVAVHLYGAPCNMTAIMEIAHEHKLMVVEDAAPAIGAHWQGQKTGTFGRSSAFSFQGAKLMVTGEGGMFCTDDTELYRRAQYLNDYAVDTNRSFHVDKLGFKYRMSNLQAALGTAQLRRIEDLLQRKRQIFDWYQERLEGTEEIRLNVEKPGSRNAFWMTSMVLAAGFKLERDVVRQKLKDKMVDTRPFFYPMSSLPMFQSQAKENPIAYTLFQRGINLPSGHNLAEDDIDYICTAIRQVMGKKTGTTTLRKKGPIAKFIIEKNRPASEALRLPIPLAGGNSGALEIMTYSTLVDDSAIASIAKWREKHADVFPVQSKTTVEGVRVWLRKSVLDVKDRVLFWVRDSVGIRVGLVGLSRLSLDQTQIEIDPILRGESTGDHGLMASAMQTLLEWQRRELHVPKSYLKVFSNNAAAIQFFSGLNFREIIRVPLKRTENAEGSNVEWKEVHGDPYFRCQRYFITMEQAEA